MKCKKHKIEMVWNGNTDCPCCDGQGTLGDHVCPKCESIKEKKRLLKVKKIMVTVVERSKILIGPKNKLLWAPLDLECFQYPFNPKKPVPRKASFVTIRNGYAETDKNGDLYVLY